MSVDTVMSGEMLRRVIDFNFFPSLEMDDSWWEPEWLTVSLLTRVRSVKATHRKLSDFILERYRIKHENHFDFGSYERQAALLNGIDLRALLYTMGLIIESKTIAGVIEKEAQRTIKESLGEADYLYALKNRMSINYRHAGDRVPFSVEQMRGATDFKTYVCQSGLRCLLALLDDMPQGFIQRILFKLPKTWSAISHDKQNDYQAIRAYLPHLFKEIRTT